MKLPHWLRTHLLWAMLILYPATGLAQKLEDRSSFPQWPVVAPPDSTAAPWREQRLAQYSHLRYRTLPEFP